MKIIIILLVLLLKSALFAQNYDFENKSFSYSIKFDDMPNGHYKFRFSNGKFHIQFPEYDTFKHEEKIYISEEKEGNYKLFTKAGMLYMTVSGKRFLILHKDKYCFLIDCSNYDTYAGQEIWNNYRIRERILDGIEPYSSCLEEMDNKNNLIKYDGNNYFFLQIRKPWIDGKKGSGIDEWIQGSFIRPIKKILLVNGYVDANNPDYYLKNERIKDAIISDEKNSYHVVLEDTPNLQIVELPDYLEGTIRLTVKSVYLGMKSTDTCLTSMFFIEEF